VVRTSGEVWRPATYAVLEAMLVPTSTPIEQTESKHSSGATWTFAFLPKQNDAR
jgi:hypothetical protein